MTPEQRSTALPLGDAQATTAAPEPTTFETISDAQAFDRLEANGWDDLVRAMRRPSPFMLHAWLSLWLKIEGKGTRAGGAGGVQRRPARRGSALRRAEALRGQGR